MATEFGIWITRHLFSCGRFTDWHRDGSGAIHSYATEAEARAAVRAIDGGVYHLSHNESGRPSCRVFRLPDGAR